MLNTIFLIGYMGAGKSAIGKSLSKNNGYKFYDLDKYIEEKEGRKISEIFNHNNEVYFRKIENSYLKEISLIKEDKIISTGGGTPCFQNNFEIIDNGSIAYNSKFDVLNESIIIVGDVSQTGKTLQMVISNLMLYNPSKIKTSVIINRDHAMFPVKINYSGLGLSTSVNEHVDVLVDKKGRLSVYLS